MHGGDRLWFIIGPVEEAPAGLSSAELHCGTKQATFSAWP